jgi:hypothetical protein
VAELLCSWRAGEPESALGLRPDCLNVPDPARHDGGVRARLQGSPVAGKLAVRFGDLTPSRGSSGIFL